MKSLPTIHFVFLAATTSLTAQVATDFTLIKPTVTSLNNTVSFTLSNGDATELHEARGEKINFNVPVIVVNGDSIKTERLQIRGTSSSYFRRKSLHVKVNKKAHFYAPNDSFSLKKFYVISMNMDRNYIRNKMSYRVLEYMGIHIPPNAYANLLINNTSEGLYLISEPPEDYAIRKLHSSVVIRRNHNQDISNLAFDGISSKEARLLTKKYQSIYKELLRKHKGAELYAKLSEVLDLNGYFTWLAYNHLFQNGDYSDELYLMWNKTKNQFEILPWDFDDLLHAKPHEGLEKRNEVLHEKLIFSGEDGLDEAIGNDEFLYMKYLQTYRNFLEKLTPSALSEILNSTYQEVYPFYLHAEIISPSQYDQGGATDLGKLETEIMSIQKYMISKIPIQRNTIDKLLKKFEAEAR